MSSKGDGRDTPKADFEHADPDPGPAEADGDVEPRSALASRRQRTDRRGDGRLGGRVDTGRLVRRYGPLAAVAVLAVAMFVVLGGGDGDGDDEPGEGEAGVVVDEEALIRSGPMTPQKARLLNASVDFGAGCDVSRGRINLPIVYAPPCVEPFTDDNGGATSPGVTAEVVKVVAYVGDPKVDQLNTGIIGGTGADLDPGLQAETIGDYAELYNKVFETYGRTVEVEIFIGTGAGADHAAAKADAIAISEKQPFAVVGGPRQASDTFADELAARGVLCLQACSLGLSDRFLEEHAPYVWADGTPDKGARFTAEAVAKLAGPGKAEMAGDPELRTKERVYGAVDYDTPDGLQAEAFEAMRDGLADNGIELEEEVHYFLDTARAQESARTFIAKLEQAGVTTVIFTGDPLMPSFLTAEATAQDYYPEWILGSNYLADTELFARTYDPEQWRNGFGVVGANPVAEDLGVAGYVYRWAYGTEPPSNISGVLEPPLRNLFIGVHLAGPDLTPESYRDGLFRYPPSGGGPTRSEISWGDHGIWPEIDYAEGDDATIVWWDPDAAGVNESGTHGKGMYRFADGGQRYELGDIPDSPDDARLFDVEASVIEYDELPAQDQAPDYPPPD